MKHRWLHFGAAVLAITAAAAAQQSAVTAPPLIVPVIRWSAPLAASRNAVTVKIAFYSEQSGGEALWTESQRVTPDVSGKTSLLIGSATEGGIPATVFANGDARFIGITVNEGAEQPRSLIAPGAYAFKAADAETLGGHPVSDFALLQKNATGKTLTNVTTVSGSNGVLINGAASSSGTGPTVALSLDANYLQALGNSIYVASVAGTNGITATRSGTGVTLSLNDSTLQSLGNSLYAQFAGNNTFSGTNTFSKPITFASSQTFPGTASLTSANTFYGPQTISAGCCASSTLALDSYFFQLNAAVYDSAQSKANPEGFILVAEPTGNNTAAPGASLHFLFADGSAGTNTETGLSLASNGRLSFASGQTFPGTGTITAINTTAPLTGSGTSGTVALGLNTSALETTLNTVYGQLGAGNTWTGGQTVNGSEFIQLTSASGVAVTAQDTAAGSAGAEIIGGSTDVSSSGDVTVGTGLYSSGEWGVWAVTTSASTVEPAIAVNAQVPLLTPASGLSSFAVRALNDATDNGTGSTSYGVYGAAADYGVYGSGNTGVYGTSTTNNGVYGTTSAAGGSAGLYGNSTATTIGSNGIPGIGVSGNASGASSYGVYGYSDGSDGIGVYGFASATGTGVLGQGQSYGVTGMTSGIAAVSGTGTNGANGGIFSSNVSTGLVGYTSGTTNAYGVAGSIGTSYSTVGASYTHDAGVWGDMENGFGAGSGVLATADDLTALWAENSSAYGSIVSQNDSTSSLAIVFQTNAPNASGGSKHCTINAAAAMTCSGNFTTVVPAHGAAVEMYAVHSTENWFEDFGSGRLHNGSATVRIDPTFASAANTGVEYHVFLTPKGNSTGLYVTAETPDSFEVREQGSGGSDIAFDYRIVAKRAGYENVRMADASAEQSELQRQMEERKNATPPHKRIPTGRPQELHPPAPPIQVVGPQKPPAVDPRVRPAGSRNASQLKPVAATK